MAEMIIVLPVTNMNIACPRAQAESNPPKFASTLHALMPPDLHTGQLIMIRQDRYNGHNT